MSELPRPSADDALFFDFDGTLVELAPRPDQICVAPDLPAKLVRLAARQGGALAVLSGRPLDQIDYWLQPASLSVAGVHGSERRGHGGRVWRLQLAGLDGVASRLQAWCDERPGLLLELKPAAIALHFRGADELETHCMKVMEAAALDLPEMTLMRGKKVLELKPKAADKGVALRAFLRETPFKGRIPYFFGDDVTDEAGFDAVNELGGVAVKVGDGPSLAGWRLPDPAAVRRWIDNLLVD